MENSELNPNKKDIDKKLEINEEEKDTGLLNEPKENIEGKESFELPNNNDENIIRNKKLQDNSLFQRFLENGFDGITTNPNYKLLALLVILLINLSLFILIGNIGKSFLRNSGLLS